uniref:PH domain-containing protein n=1 Tax=Macrostomum lignano TaxID=282301 RepID=A0A1I8FG38_9PLAT
AKPAKECFYALLLCEFSGYSIATIQSGQYRSSPFKVEEVNQQPVYLSTETPLDFQLWFEALASAAQMQRLQPEHSSRPPLAACSSSSSREDSLGGGGVEVVTRNHQYNYRDENGGGGGDANAHASLSQPTLATAEGQYNFRQQYEMQQPPQRAASTTVTSTTDSSISASARNNGAAYTDGHCSPRRDQAQVPGVRPGQTHEHRAASDLLGKSHDELLLLLIQLNREKASLERRRDYYLALLPDMRGADRMQAELREIDNQIELHDPLITFINNIISMGSLYSGDDVMFASEYRQHLLQPGELKPVKANVGFLRKQQERDAILQPVGPGLGRRGHNRQRPGESREFSVTRQQLEAELNELETVYAEHRRKKTNLAAFMSDLGKRAAGASSGKSFVSISSVAGSGVSGGGSYLETDLDTGASVDLAAKFPQRRTAVPRGSSSASASTGAVRVQQQKSKTMPSKTHDANGVPLRSAGGAEAAMRDDFQPRQQQQQQNYGIS